MSRPPRYSQDQQADMCALRASGARLREIAERYGCSTSTIYRITDPEGAARHADRQARRYETDPDLKARRTAQALRYQKAARARKQETQ